MSQTQNPLSKNAQIVQNVLNQKGLEFKVMELPASTRTANEAALQLVAKLRKLLNLSYL